MGRRISRFPDILACESMELATELRIRYLRYTTAMGLNMLVWWERALVSACRSFARSCGTRRAP